MKSSLLALFVGVASASLNETNAQWGCGLLGALPGISQNGTTSEAMRMLEGLKSSSSFGKVSYWNWDLAPKGNDDGTFQYLTKDMLFMPEQWGLQPVVGENVRQADTSSWLDDNGDPSPATMANIFLGSNEPDIIGSCMGNMMGKCTGLCTADEVASGCPVAQLDGADADPLPNGHCDCWSSSHATGAGYWPFGQCAAAQPLPALFTDPDRACVAEVMSAWRDTAATVVSKGYKYLSTPLVAVSMDWLAAFMEAACADCSEVACGCPSHVGWHFYASDCRPTELGGYADFKNKLDKTKELMEKYPHLQGAIVNEVGMLNCAQIGGGVCIPNGDDQMYPAVNETDHACPATDELPNGLGTFVEELIDMVIDAGTTADGRPVVAGFSWFNENMAGGTYNLRIFDDDGTINQLGESYIRACQKWAAVQAGEDVKSPSSSTGDDASVGVDAEDTGRNLLPLKVAMMIAVLLLVVGLTFVLCKRAKCCKKVQRARSSSTRLGFDRLRGASVPKASGGPEELELPETGMDVHG